MNSSLASKPSPATCKCAVHRRKSTSLENAYWDLAIHVLALGPVGMPNEKAGPRLVTQPGHVGRTDIRSSTPLSA